jgi:hypothetical protein
MTTPSVCLTLYSGPITTIDPLTRTGIELGCMGYPNATLANWKAAWASPIIGDPDKRFCGQYFHDLIYSLGGNAVFDPTVFPRIQEDFEFMLSKYFNNTIQGSNIALPGESNFNDFQTTLVNACAEIPGVCDTAQKKLCAGCTRADISNNPDIITLCGCYSPDLSVAIYGRNIPKQCDPLCNNGTAAKLASSLNGIVNACTDTVCVIDNISITATKSTIGGIRINQVCPGCNTGCTCIVDTSVLNIASNLGIDDPTLFQQYCPPALSTCLVIDSVKQTSTVVPCSNTFNTGTPTFSSAIPTMMWVIFALIIIVVLLALAAYIYEANSKEIYVPRIRDYKPPPGTNILPVTSYSGNKQVVPVKAQGGYAAISSAPSSYGVVSSGYASVAPSSVTYTSNRITGDYASVMPSFITYSNGRITGSYASVTPNSTTYSNDRINGSYASVTP